MKKGKKRSSLMISEYNFKGGTRGKYAKRYRSGTNIIVLEPDMAKVFPDSTSVNRALRTIASSFRHKKNH